MAEALVAMEQKVRNKAANKGFDVTNAIYVLKESRG